MPVWIRWEGSLVLIYLLGSHKPPSKPAIVQQGQVKSLDWGFDGTEDHAEVTLNSV